VSAQHSRLLVALANILILAGIAYLGVRAFIGQPVVSSEQPPSNFNPINYDIPMSSGRKSSEREHAVSWQQLDRPERVPVVAARPGRPLPKPTPQTMASRYTLIMTNYDAANADASTVILNGPTGTKIVGVGDTFDGYEVKSIVISGEGETRQAEVTIISNGRENTISYRRSKTK
jgi:hypothetical protein